MRRKAITKPTAIGKGSFDVATFNLLPGSCPFGSRQEQQFRRGLSQAEVVVSTIIVGVLMVSCFSTIAASRRSQMSESDEVRGLAIAEALMAEITELPMREPSCDCGYGLEVGETGPDRLNFDDVDDYQNLTDSPPMSRKGTAYSGYSDLSRSVAINMVTTADWNATTATYAGVYRITVKVLRGTLEVCRIVGYRTSGSPGSSSIVGVNSLN
ncbi:MAG TPA: hypothetical protein VM260_19590 [Pirellula sp.]|nr:hypothetical protein [Pirellula sp.]